MGQRVSVVGVWLVAGVRPSAVNYQPLSLSLQERILWLSGRGLLSADDGRPSEREYTGCDVLGVTAGAVEAHLAWS